MGTLRLKLLWICWFTYNVMEILHSKGWKSKWYKVIFALRCQIFKSILVKLHNIFVAMLTTFEKMQKHKNSNNKVGWIANFTCHTLLGFQLEVPCMQNQRLYRNNCHHLLFSLHENNSRLSPVKLRRKDTCKIGKRKTEVDRLVLFFSQKLHLDFWLVYVIIRRVLLS